VTNIAKYLTAGAVAAGLLAPGASAGAVSHPKAVKSCAAAERPRLVATMHPYGRGVTV
jgi:hypothetical protein